MPTTKKDSKTVYVCGVDWQHEIGEASDGNKVYASPEDLKKYGHGDSGCGIVECTVTFKRWVQKQDFQKMRASAIPASELTKIQIKEVKNKIEVLEKFLRRLENEIKSNPKAKTKLALRNQS